PASVAGDGAAAGRAGVASVRDLLARFCERPQFVYRVAPVKPKHAVARSLAGQVLLRADPARVNVDCPGPVREDVPSRGFLGEGLGTSSRTGPGQSTLTRAEIGRAHV